MTDNRIVHTGTLWTRAVDPQRWSLSYETTEAGALRIWLRLAGRICRMQLPWFRP